MILLPPLLERFFGNNFQLFIDVCNRGVKGGLTDQGEGGGTKIENLDI